jgi:hypothetical protein
MSICQHLHAKELVDLRTTYETAKVTYDEAKAAYEEKKAALIARMVAGYQAEAATLSPAGFKAYLHNVMQDEELEEAIWAATVATLTPEAFQGWYMLRRNGQDVTVFQAANNREAGQHLRSLRHGASDKTIVWSYVPMAEAVFAKI